MSTIIESLEQRQLRTDLPPFKAGDTVRVHFKVIEGKRQRVQVFEGIVHQAPGLRRPRDVHRAQAVVRRRRRADVPAPLAEDREARGRDDRRRATARSSTTCAGESARRRASASSGRASVYPRPRGSIQRPAAPRVRPQARRALRRRAPTRRVAARSPGRSSSPASCSTTRTLRDPRVRPLAPLNDSKQVAAERARGALPGGRRVRARDHRAGRSRPARSTATGCTARTSPGCARCSPTSSRPPRSASSTASGSGRPRRRTARSSTATRRARRSRRRRSSRRSSRPGDAAARRALPALRLRLARRLHHAGAHRGRPRARAVASSTAARSRPPATPRRREPRRATRPPALPAARLPAARRRTREPGGYELDLVLRRGDRVVFVEVKEKSGSAFGHPFEMVDEEKVRRVRHGSWELAGDPSGARRAGRGVRGRRRSRSATWSECRWRRTPGRAVERSVHGSDAGRALRRALRRAPPLVVGAGAPRARADEARPPSPPVPREVRPAARRGASRSLRGSRAAACSTRSPARGRRSSSASSPGTTRSASTSRRSTAC